VGEDGKVDIRSVEPGERVGGFWVVDKGLKPGEKVIVAGLQYMQPGMMVKAKPAPAEEGPAPPGPLPTPAASPAAGVPGAAGTSPTR